MPSVVARKAPSSPRLEARSIRARADKMLEHLDLSNRELSILLTDDRAIQQLNAKHRNVDRPTDVLAFPMSHHVSSEGSTAETLLGDVAVSLDTAARQAKKKGHPLLEEVTFLVAHGLLHLVGYDHLTAADERHMTALTQRLLNAATSRHPRS